MRRLARIAARAARARQMEAPVAVATYNVCTLAVQGKNGYGYAECVLAKAGQLDCGFIGLQEKRSSGTTEFSATGYRVFCSSQEETEGRQRLYGVGLAVKRSMCRMFLFTYQLIDERLLSMRFELTGECAAVNVVVAYVFAPTEANPNTELKEFFWKRFGGLG